MPPCAFYRVFVCIGICTRGRFCASHADYYRRQSRFAAQYANQTIAIPVTGGDLVEGLNFNVLVGDGGAAYGGVDTGPLITNVNITQGATIFAPNNTGRRGGTDISSPALCGK